MSWALWVTPAQRRSSGMKQQTPRSTGNRQEILHEGLSPNQRMQRPTGYFLLFSQCFILGIWVFFCKQPFAFFWFCRRAYTLKCILVGIWSFILHIIWMIWYQFLKNTSGIGLITHSANGMAGLWNMKADLMQCGKLKIRPIVYRLCLNSGLKTKNKDL